MYKTIEPHIETTQYNVFYFIKNNSLYQIERNIILDVVDIDGNDEFGNDELFTDIDEFLVYFS